MLIIGPNLNNQKWIFRHIPKDQGILFFLFGKSHSHDDGFREY